MSSVPCTIYPVIHISKKMTKIIPEAGLRSYLLIPTGAVLTGYYLNESGNCNADYALQYCSTLFQTELLQMICRPSISELQWVTNKSLSVNV